MPGDRNFLGIPRVRGIPWRYLPIMLVVAAIQKCADYIKWN